MAKSRSFKSLGAALDTAAAQFEKARTVAVELTRDLERRGYTSAVIGGLAVAAHGYVRMTTDVDLVIGSFGDTATPFDGNPLAEIPGVSFTHDDVDVEALYLDEGEDFLDAAIEHAVRHGKDRLRVIPIEALVYLKLKASRPKDLLDVRELFKLGAFDAARVRKYLHRAPEHRREDVVSEFDAQVAIAAAERSVR